MAVEVENLGRRLVESVCVPYIREERQWRRWWICECNLVLISNCRAIVVWKRLAYFLCFDDRAPGDLFSRYDLQDATDAFGVSHWFVLLQHAESLNSD